MSQPVWCDLPAYAHSMPAAEIQKRMQRPYPGRVFNGEMSLWHPGQGRQKTACRHSQGYRSSEVMGPRWAQVHRQAGPEPDPEGQRAELAGKDSIPEGHECVGKVWSPSRGKAYLSHKTSGPLWLRWLRLSMTSGCGVKQMASRGRRGVALRPEPREAKWPTQARA